MRYSCKDSEHRESFFGSCTTLFNRFFRRNTDGGKRFMEILKIWRHGVSGELYRKKAINYALNERKVIWQCYGVQTDFPYTIFDQMKIVSDLWGNNGKNPVFHFVISFEKRTVNDPYVAMAYVKQIFEHLLLTHQMVISIHKEDHRGSLYHAHVVVSTTNFLNGDLFQKQTRLLF